MFADLRRGTPTGERGENDLTTEVEGASGGEGADRLVARRCDGPWSRAHVRGNGGDDLLIGSAGNDVLDAGSGSDRIDGRGGDDTIELGGARNINDQNRVQCGEGTDEVRGLTERDIISAHCERYTFLGSFGGGWFHGLGVRTAPVFGGAIQERGSRRFCKVQARLVARGSSRREAPRSGTVLAVREVRGEQGVCRIALRLPKRWWRALRAADRLPVRVRIRWTFRDGRRWGATAGFDTELRWRR